MAGRVEKEERGKKRTVRPIGTDVRERADLAGVVEAIGAVGGRVVGQETRYRGGLVGGEREDVAEAAAGVDDRFTGLLRLRVGGGGDCCVGLDLGCSDADFCEVRWM